MNFRENLLVVGVPADASAVVGISTISGIPALSGPLFAFDVIDVPVVFC
jgi:hypothetical protein